ncbi:MAG: tetratricopeptide repeat protein [Caldilineaceae bacterium]|nr:tetratricopeptide repeat protein [Caldilineaceae bacterium]MXZ19423.1 tetratricopeptide repeat protein [Caldilineaceae bacterium SB0665_bin_25]
MTESDRNSSTSENGGASADYRRILNESARLLRANRPGEAIAVLEPLQADMPDDPDIAINMGGALILQRKWAKAVKILKKAVDASPENVLLWTNLAAAYLGRLETSGPKHQARAIAAYEKALWIDPATPNVHYHLGLIYKQQGNLSRSSAMFQRALEINPNDRDARYWMEKLSDQMVEREREKKQNRSQHGRGNGRRGANGRPPDLGGEES